MGQSARRYPRAWQLFVSICVHMWLNCLGRRRPRELWLERSCKLSLAVEPPAGIRFFPSSANVPTPVAPTPTSVSPDCPYPPMKTTLRVLLLLSLTPALLSAAAPVARWDYGQEDFSRAVAVGEVQRDVPGPRAPEYPGF